MRAAAADRTRRGAAARPPPCTAAPAAARTRRPCPLQSSQRAGGGAGRATGGAPGRRCFAARAAGSGAPVLVEGPPPGYDYKADVLPETLEVVSAFPSLLPLVEAGNLVALRRPAGYERRRDGYREPGLVFVLGTAHVSARSAEEVAAVVAAVAPQCVVVELCKSRVGVLGAPDVDDQPEERQQQQQQQQRQQAAEGQQLLSDVEAAASSSAAASLDEEAAAAAAAERAASGGAASGSGRGSSSGARAAALAAKAASPWSLAGDNFFAAVARSARLGGQSGLLLRLLIAGQARQAADRLNTTPGAEFRAAARAADRVGASLVLGDRPIEITLERAWAALSWRQRAQLLSDLLLAGLAPQAQALDADAVEALRGDDAINAFFAQLGARYPTLLAPLVHERDLYLAWSLKRSKAVNGAAAVVGVVGKGHLRGVVYALRHDVGGGALRFSDLVGGKNTRAAKRAAAAAAAARLGAEAALGLGLWAAWLAAHGELPLGPGR
ncbi:Trabd [Scenedesmus sp. PABB004]|nr:Trabd [Scenedesmus sp. PABB004]